MLRGYTASLNRAEMLIKKLAFFLIPILLLCACSPVAAKPLYQSSEPTPQKAIEPKASSTPQPNIATSPNPTDVFITQVMATKYAARTQYASIPTNTPTPTIPAGSPDCQPADLQTSYVPGAGGQHIDIFVQVTNIGQTACFVPAWPVVQLLDRTGKPLVLAYDYIQYNANPLSVPPTETGNPGKPLEYGFEAGQTANFFLSWGDWCQEAVPGGVIVRMFLLDDSGWVDIPTDIGGGGHCQYDNSISTVDVFGFPY